MFTTPPMYYLYRTLFLTSPQLRGEDVYALQTGLNELSFNAGEADGILGPSTEQGIRTCQKAFQISVDGKAGGGTQKELALELADRVSKIVRVPFTAFKGQLELESDYRLGSYSPQRPDGSYDAGVAQRNTRFTTPEKGFNCQASIQALGVNTRQHYDLFAGLEARRRWSLAQGAWNAPAFACYIAREEGANKVTAGMTARPGTEARKAFENYVNHASVYLTV